MVARYNLLKRYGGEVKLKEAMNRFPAVRDEINAELARLKGVSAGRCVVSSEYAASLRRVLDGDVAGAATPPTSLQIGGYTLMEDPSGGLQVKAPDGSMIPLVQKDP